VSLVVSDVLGKASCEKQILISEKRPTRPLQCKDHNVNSPCRRTYISFYVSSENLVSHQENITDTDALLARGRSP